MPEIEYNNLIGRQRLHNTINFIHLLFTYNEIVSKYNLKSK